MLRGAFDRLRLRLGVDPRILPVRTQSSYLFGEHSCTVWPAWRALVHLRHVHAAHLERAAAAEQRRAAAAARAASHAERRAAAEEAKREVREAKAQARGQRAFGAIVKRLVARAERADARGETRRAILRIRRRHRAALRFARAHERGQRAGRRVFGRLVAEGERRDVQRATRGVLARLRERHRLRSVFGAIVQRLVSDAEAATVAARCKCAGGAPAAVGDAQAGPSHRAAGRRGMKRATGGGLAVGGPRPKRTRGAYGGGEGGSSRSGGYSTL